MLTKFIKDVFGFAGVEISRRQNEQDRFDVLYKKFQTFTMVPDQYFKYNLELCNKFKDVQGDYVECGVWKGGMSAAIAEVLGPERKVHLFDSFQGLPPAKEIDGKEALSWQNNTTSSGYFDNCSAEESFSHQAMSLANHNQYEIHPGWFDQTLPAFKNRSIGILRLDGDWYDSIMTCMVHLFPQVVDGGIIIIDDYYTWDGCSKAVHDYLASIKSPSRIFQWNNHLAFIRKKNE